MLNLKKLKLKKSTFKNRKIIKKFKNFKINV